MCPGPPQSAYSAAFDQPFREHPEQRSNVVRTLIGSGRNMHPELAHRDCGRWPSRWARLLPFAADARSALHRAQTVIDRPQIAERCHQRARSC